MALPVIVLAATTTALITRTTRAAMLETMDEDYVRTARAKGLSEQKVIQATHSGTRSCRWLPCRGSPMPSC